MITPPAPPARINPRAVDVVSAAVLMVECDLSLLLAAVAEARPGDLSGVLDRVPALEEDIVYLRMALASVTP